MTRKKLKGLMALVRMRVQISHVEENELKKYAINILQNAQGAKYKKISSWWLKDLDVIDDIENTINNLWEPQDVVNFILRFNPKVKKHVRAKKKKS